MNITMKTLTALAIATVALTATVLPSSALPNSGRPGAGDSTGTYSPHGPKQPTQPTKLPPAWQRLGNAGAFKELGNLKPAPGPGPYHCLVCEHLPPPVGPAPVTGDGGHDGHGWHRGPEIIVEGGPQTIAVAAPVQSMPAQSASVQSAPARVSAAATVATQAGASPCNCLTKQSLPDGSVLFQDICTKESAIAAPATLGAR